MLCVMTETGRIQHTKRNIIWAVLARLVAVVGPFIIRMLLIRNLGAQYLGLGSFYTSLLQIFNLAELGFSSAIAYGMYAPIALNNKQTIAAFANYLKHVYRIVGFAIVGLGLCAMPLLGVLINGPTPPDVHVQGAFALYLLNAVLGYFLSAYKQTVLTAFQRKDVVDKVLLGVMLLQFVVQSFLLVFAPNFYTYALVMPLSTLVANGLIALLANHYFPWLNTAQAKRARLGAQERHHMHKRVAGLVLQRASIITRDSFGALAVSFFLGLNAVAIYTNYFVVASGLAGVLGTIGFAMTASVGNSIALEDEEKNFNDLRSFVSAYAFLSLVCAACLMAMYQLFIELWVGPSQVLPLGSAVLFVVYFYVRTMGDMRTVYVDATGIWWQLRWRALAEAIVNIVLSIILVRVMGITGAILAMLTSLFAVNFLYGSHLVFKFYFGIEKARSYYIDHFFFLIVGACICTLAYGASCIIPGQGLITLLAKGLVAFGVAVVLILLVLRKTPWFGRAAALANNVLNAKIPLNEKNELS